MVFLPYILFLVSFEWFLLHVVPGVYFGDCGEVLSAVFTMGTPHPTGFPAYVLPATLLARFGGTPFWVNALSAFMAALSVVLLAQLVRRWTGSVTTALMAVLVLSTSQTFLVHSATARVYTLNLALILGFILAAVRAGTGRKTALSLGFIAGLGFATHLLFAAAPVFAAVLLVRRHERWRDLVPWALAGGMLSFTLYLWLPIRSAQHPPVDWGHPSTWGYFMDYLVQREYRSKMFARDLEGFLRYSRTLYGTFSKQWPWSYWLLAVLGGWTIHRGQRRLLGAMLVVILFTAVLLAFYGHGLDLLVAYRYHLPAYAMVAVLAALGVKRLVDLGPVPLRRPLTVLALLLLAVILFHRAWPWRNLSRTLAGDDFAEDVMRVMDRGTFMTLDKWGDNQIYPLAYGRYVMGWRKDLRFADWSARLFPEAQQALQQGAAPTPSEVEDRWFADSGGIMYVPVDTPGNTRFANRSAGYIFRVTRAGDALRPEPVVTFRSRSASPYPPDREGVETWAFQPLARAFTAWDRGQREETLRYLEEACRVGSLSSDVFSNAGTVYFFMKEYARAEEAFRKAVDMQPEDLTSRINLAVLYVMSHRLPEARAQLERVLRSDPGNEMARRYLDRVMRAMNGR